MLRPMENFQKRYQELNPEQEYRLVHSNATCKTIVFTVLIFHKWHTSDTKWNGGLVGKLRLTEWTNFYSYNNLDPE